MNTKLFSSVMTWVAVCAAMLVSSCSRDDSALQSSIPADYEMLVAVNGERLIDAMGWKYDGEGFCIPKDVKEKYHISDTRMRDIETLMSLSAAIDIKSIYCVVSREGDFATAAVKDASKLERAATEQGGMSPAEVRGGYDAVYTRDRLSLLVRDSQCWLVDREPSAALAFIDGVLERASKKSFSSLPGIAEAVATGDGFARVALSQKGMAKLSGMTGDDAKGNHTFANIAENSGSLLVTGSTFDNQGNTVEAQGMQTVSLDFLRYVPSDFNIAFAMGITPDFDWKPVANVATALAGYNGASIVEILKPYLSHVDGTVAVACSLSSASDLDALADGNYAALPFLLMVHMDQATVNDAVETLAGAFTMAKIPFQKRANGTYALTAGGGMNLEFGSVNGYFTVASIPLKTLSGNPFTTTFEGKDMAAVVQLPSLADFGVSVGYGINVTMSSAGGNSKLVLKLTGTDEPILPVLLSTFSLL